jgi:hypothetical protein
MLYAIGSMLIRQSGPSRALALPPKRTGLVGTLNLKRSGGTLPSTFDKLNLKNQKKIVALSAPPKLRA